MFREEYQKEFEKVRVSPERLQELYEKAEEKTASKRGQWMRIIRPIAIPALSLCLICMLAVPALAKSSPAVYRLVQQLVPSLADDILPEEVSCTRNGLTLQVEAVNVAGNQAKVLVSFCDAQGSGKDLIHGMVDLYDSYRISNYGEKLVSSGCSFLKYDEAEDKAYFLIQIQSDKPFDRNKIKFGVAMVLTNCVEEEQSVSLEALLPDPAEKTVQCIGISGSESGRSGIPYLDDDRTASVMAVTEWSASMKQALTITGLSYDRGVLRVQQCRGSLREADRYASFVLRRKDGAEKTEDCKADWIEEIDGERINFAESWFALSEEELKEYELVGNFMLRDGSVRGEWEVVVNLNREE